MTLYGNVQLTWDEIKAGAILDCGHPRSKYEGIGTGYAQKDGKVFCYDCAEARERIDLFNAVYGEPFFAYLIGPVITTWTGAKLATVKSSWVHDVAVPGVWSRVQRHYFVAVDIYGRRWYGNGPGNGQYCRMRLYKSQPTLPITVGHFNRALMYYNNLGTVATVEAAEGWIADMERVDPEGIHAGRYYVDVPEEMQVKG